PDSATALPAIVDASTGARFIQPEAVELAMKTISLDSESTTLEQVLQEASGGEVVFLTKEGQTRFALVAADEGDQEVCALKSNAEFMAYLTEAERRARTRPRKSLQQIRDLYNRPAEQPGSEERP